MGSQGTRRGNISWGTGRLAGVIFLSGRPAGEIITWVALVLAVLGFSLGLVVGPALGEPRDQKRENISWGTHHLGCFRIGSAGVLTGRVAGDITRAGGWACTWLGLVVGPALGKPRDQKREHQLGLG